MTMLMSAVELSAVLDLETWGFVTVWRVVSLTSWGVRSSWRIEPGSWGQAVVVMVCVTLLTDRLFTILIQARFYILTQSTRRVT